MSEENVESVRRIYKAFQSEDWGSAMRFVSPEIEFHGTSGGLSEGNVARGIPAIREMFEVWDEEAWEESRLSPRSSSTPATGSSSSSTSSGGAAVAAWRSSPKPQSSSNFATDA